MCGKSDDTPPLQFNLCLNKWQALGKDVDDYNKFVDKCFEKSKSARSPARPPAPSKLAAHSGQSPEPMSNSFATLDVMNARLASGICEAGMAEGRPETAESLYCPAADEDPGYAMICRNKLKTINDTVTRYNDWLHRCEEAKRAHGSGLKNPGEASVDKQLPDVTGQSTSQVLDDIEREAAKLSEIIKVGQCPQQTQPISDVNPDQAGCPGSFDPASLSMDGKKCAASLKSLNNKIDDYNDFLKTCSNVPPGDVGLSKRIDEAKLKASDPAEVDSQIEATRLQVEEEAAEAKISRDRKFDADMRRIRAEQRARAAAIEKHNREVAAYNEMIARQNALASQQNAIRQQQYRQQQQANDDAILGSILNGAMSAFGAYNSYNQAPQYSNPVRRSARSARPQPRGNVGGSSDDCRGPGVCTAQ
jgi:transcription elongation factor Elf1